MNAIEVVNLTKKFGSFIAVDDISFNVRQGEIFGFLGANGAGKSTTIRMLCGLMASTSGTAIVAGYDINKNPELVKRNIGYMSQKFSLYDDLTVFENLHFFGGIYGIQKHILRDRIAWAVKIAGLEMRRNTLTGELPVGWKQRLALVCALLHRPKIVFLDEPTGGVDPISRRGFWELIYRISEEGTTVFVTTHYLDEAEYCNTIMLIHGGKIIAGGSPHQLKKNHVPYPIFSIECDDPEAAFQVLRGTEWIRNLSFFGIQLHVMVKDEDDAGSLVRMLKRANITCSRIERIDPTLEHVFIQLIALERNVPSLQTDHS